MSEISWLGVSGGILATVIVLGVFAVWRMSRELRSGFPLQDERTRLITGRAATFAFYIGSYFMIALMLANILYLEFLDAPLLDAGYALVISVLVQSLSFLGFRYYFNVKEE